MNRNLKDDLEVVEKARQFTKITGWGSKEFHELSPYFSKFHEEGLDIAKHAIERALKAEKALGNETILNGRALAKLNERALKAEALARELVAALQGVSGMLDYATRRCRCGVCEYCNVQKRVDKALAKAKEVLGDE